MLVLNRRRAIMAISAVCPAIILAGGCQSALTDSATDLSILTRLAELQLPLSNIDKAIYKDIALNIIEASTKDDALKGAISSATKALKDKSWQKKSEDEQIAHLRELDKEPWFFLLNFQASAMFFENPAIWPNFEYDGPSLDEGGYKNRGFNSIDWLPEMSE